MKNKISVICKDNLILRKKILLALYHVIINFFIFTNFGSESIKLCKFLESCQFKNQLPKLSYQMSIQPAFKCPLFRLLAINFTFSKWEFFVIQKELSIDIGKERNGRHAFFLSLQIKSSQTFYKIIILISQKFKFLFSILPQSVLVSSNKKKFFIVLYNKSIS